MAWARACAMRQARRDTRILSQESKEGSDSEDGAGARLGSRGRSFTGERALTCKAVEIGRKCGSERLHGPNLRLRRYHAALGYSRTGRVYLAAWVSGTHRRRIAIHHHCAAARVTGNRRNARECRGNGREGHNRQHQDRAFFPHGHILSRILTQIIF